MIEITIHVEEIALPSWSNWGVEPLPTFYSTSKMYGAFWMREIWPCSWNIPTKRREKMLCRNVMDWGEIDQPHSVPISELVSEGTDHIGTGVNDRCHWHLLLMRTPEGMIKSLSYSLGLGSDHSWAVQSWYKIELLFFSWLSFGVLWYWSTIYLDKSSKFNLMFFGWLVDW